MDTATLRQRIERELDAATKPHPDAALYAAKRAGRGCARLTQA